MAKYSYKCKKQIVKEYVKGNGSDYVLAKSMEYLQVGKYVSGLPLIKNGAIQSRMGISNEGIYTQSKTESDFSKHVQKGKLPR